MCWRMFSLFLSLSFFNFRITSLFGKTHFGHNDFGEGQILNCEFTFLRVEVYLVFLFLLESFLICDSFQIYWRKFVHNILELKCFVFSFIPFSFLISLSFLSSLSLLFDQAYQMKVSIIRYFKEPALVDTDLCHPDPSFRMSFLPQLLEVLSPTGNLNYRVPPSPRPHPYHGAAHIQRLTEAGV